MPRRPDRPSAPWRRSVYRPPAGIVLAHAILAFEFDQMGKYALPGKPLEGPLQVWINSREEVVDRHSAGMQRRQDLFLALGAMLDVVMDQRRRILDHRSVRRQRACRIEPQQ